jgi:hypothetical protein
MELIEAPDPFYVMIYTRLDQGYSGPSLEFFQPFFSTSSPSHHDKKSV